MKYFFFWNSYFAGKTPWKLLSPKGLDSSRHSNEAAASRVPFPRRESKRVFLGLGVSFSVPGTADLESGLNWPELAAPCHDRRRFFFLAARR